MDRDIYKANMLRVLQGQHELFDTKEVAKNLEILQANVSNLIVSENKCQGIVLKDGLNLTSDAVILTTGTFLGGRVHIGNRSMEAGRFMRNSKKIVEDFDTEVLEPPSNEMSKSIRSLGFAVDRQRTGTPPRLKWSSIDFSSMEV